MPEPCAGEDALELASRGWERDQCRVSSREWGECWAHLSTHNTTRVACWYRCGL